jgi:hypothetical protein
MSIRPRAAKRMMRTIIAVWGLAAVSAVNPVQAAAKFDRASAALVFFPAPIRTWTQLYQHPLTLTDLRESLQIRANLDRAGFVRTLAGSPAAAPPGAKAAPEIAIDATTKPAAGMPKANQAKVLSTGALDVSYGLQSLEQRLGTSPAVEGDQNIEETVQPRADGPLATYPVPKAQLDSMRAHAAKLGLPTSAAVDETAMPAQADMTTRRSSRRSVVDASEGTAIDPLLNKSYDLNSAKTIPALR